MKPSTTESYLQALFTDSGMVELRHSPRQKVWVSTWHDNVEGLLADARAKSGQGNLYTSLNAPKLRMLSSTDPVKNVDIMRVTRIPFDFDPVRKVGTASTPEELQLAFKRREAVGYWLRDAGWPLPVVAISGNGHHLQYRTALPSNAETADMFKSIYRGLADLFSDGSVIFDVKVKNPGRIFRLYNSTNRKGGEERETKVWMPPRFQQVKPRQVEQLANHFARQARPVLPQRTYKPVDGQGNYNTLDLVSWFSRHGLYEHHIEANKHAVICPWEQEHSEANPNDTVIFEDADGWGGFYCHHSHCHGRNLKDVMAVLGDADDFCSEKFGGAS